MNKIFKQLISFALAMAMMLSALLPLQLIAYAQEDEDISITETESNNENEDNEIDIIEDIKEDTVENYEEAEEYRQNYSTMLTAEESSGEYENFIYRINENYTATLCKYIGEDSEINIPPSINGYPVVELEKEIFKSNLIIKKINILNAVKVIGEDAFAGCISLENVYIHDNSELLQIGNYAFKNCENLKEIHLPNSLKVLGNQLFAGCTSLKEINVPSSITEGYMSFQNSYIEKITINDGLIKIPEHIFSDMSYLKEIEIPDSVTIIDNFAFRRSSIPEVKLPKNLKKMGKDIFDGCNNLTEIMIPKTVEESQGALNGSNIKVLGFEYGTVTIPYRIAYNCNSIQSLRIPATVTKITNQAFKRENSILDIQYGGTMRQWENILIEDIEEFNNALITCIDGILSIGIDLTNFNLKIFRADCLFNSNYYPFYNAREQYKYGITESQKYLINSSAFEKIKYDFKNLMNGILGTQEETKRSIFLAAIINVVKDSMATDWQSEYDYLTTKSELEDKGKFFLKFKEFYDERCKEEPEFKDYFFKQTGIDVENLENVGDIANKFLALCDFYAKETIIYDAQNEVKSLIEELNLNNDISLSMRYATLELRFLLDKPLHYTVLAVGKMSADYVVKNTLFKKIDNKLAAADPQAYALWKSSDRDLNNFANADDVVSAFFSMKAYGELSKHLSILSQKYKLNNYDLITDENEHKSGKALSGYDMLVNANILGDDSLLKMYKLEDDSLYHKLLDDKRTKSERNEIKTKLGNEKNTINQSYKSYTLAWQDALKLEGKVKYIKKAVTVACPVNVYVYTLDDVLIGTIADGKLDIDSDYIDDIGLILDGEEKTVLLPQDGDYKIVVKAYDDGEMDVSVKTYDEDYNLERCELFNDVGISNGTDYIMDVLENAPDADSYLTASLDGVEKGVINSDYDSSDTNQQTVNVEVFDGIIVDDSNIGCLMEEAVDNKVELVAILPSNAAVFDGWETNIDGVLDDEFSPNTIVTIPDSDLEIRAKYHFIDDDPREIHTVQFMDADSNIIKTVEVRNGETVVFPTVNNTNGFIGWYTHGENGLINQKFTNETPIEECLVLYPEYSLENTITGSIGSQMDNGEKISLVLYDNNNNIVSNIMIDGNSENYEIPDVKNGTYTLSVYKFNHVTRDYQVTVLGDTVLDIVIYPYGDLTGDYVVDSADTTMLRGHISQVDLLDNYRLKCADLNYDGVIDSTDTSLLRAHIGQVESLWIN